MEKETELWWEEKPLPHEAEPPKPKVLDWEIWETGEALKSQAGALFLPLQSMLKCRQPLAKSDQEPAGPGDLKRAVHLKDRQFHRPLLLTSFPWPMPDKEQLDEAEGEPHLRGSREEAGSGSEKDKDQAGKLDREDKRTTESGREEQRRADEAGFGILGRGELGEVTTSDHI